MTDFPPTAGTPWFQMLRAAHRYAWNGYGSTAYSYFPNWETNRYVWAHGDTVATPYSLTFPPPIQLALSS
jgi:hypothetical protein